MLMALIGAPHLLSFALTPFLSPNPKLQFRLPLQHNPHSLTCTPTFPAPQDRSVHNATREKAFIVSDFILLNIFLRLPSKYTFLISQQRGAD